jgi:rhamnogalacturonan endolyase
MKFLIQKFCFIGIFLAVAVLVNGQRQMENLDRGLVAVKVSNGVFLNWRILGTEFTSTSYNIYRDGSKIATVSNTGASNYTDASGSTSSAYYVRAVVNGAEQAASATVNAWSANYKDINLSIPGSLTMPDGTTCTYSPNDCSVGDVNGDGQYEIIVKWDPSNAKDNSQSGYTGNVYLDAYTLSGTRLWRIDLGKNIRAGAHYTQFLVYDFDGDGKAELVCKTAPGTKDGKGNYLSNGPASSDNDGSDYRNSSGYILTGPEYLTVFRGTDGGELQTINYEVARGTVSDWGDSYGNRVDRFLACVAYLDGKTPSIVMCRGYYTRAYLVAYNWNGSSLSKKWAFDSKNNTSYNGQGNHNLSVADVDNDGYDEIIYGSCCIDHNGSGKYSTGLGHGDALHVGDLDPSRSGLEVWQCHEGGSGATFRDANTGAVIWKYSNSADVGRAMADDISSSSKGAECWASGSNLYGCTGTSLSTSRPSVNFGIWWDGDELRELLDGTTITKYGGSTLLSASDCSSNNGTKATPNLSADIFGDWREEAIWRTSDNSKLRIYTTTTTTSRRMYTLMHDKMYRLGIAWQNVAYNQPPHLSFFFGDGMSTPPTPNITLVGGTVVNNLTASPTNISLGSGSSSQSITITSNVSWTASSNQSWLTLSSTSGSNNGTITATAAANTSSSSRTAIITISGGSISVTITVNQSGSGSVNTITIQENTTGFCSVDGTVDSNNAGFTGAGFANSNNASAAGITWSVNIPSAGSYTLKWRYANGTTADRPGALKIDGTTVSNVSLPGTGAWTTWTETSGTTINFAAGDRKIRLEATTANGLSNIDYISIAGNNPIPVSCTGLKSGLMDVTRIDPTEEEVDFDISPNPVKDLVKIHLSNKFKPNTTLQLLNNTGSVILTQKIEGSDKILDISTLPSGIYMIVISDSDNSIIRKLVKK